MASLFAITAGPGTAQVKATIDRAEKLFEQEDYYNALPLFEELIYKGQDVTNSHLKAGMCNLFLSQPDKGLTHIRQARNPQNEVNPNYQFWLGRAYHLTMKIDSALHCYRKYLMVASPSDDYRKGVEDLIAQIHRTEIHFLHGEKAPFDVQNLGENVNSTYTEHSPLLSPDGRVLVFTSRRPLFANEVPEADGQYAEKLYYSVLASDGKWGKAFPLHPRSRLKGQFSSVQWLGKSDRLLLYSPDHGGSLWETELNGIEFGEPVASRLEVPARYFRPDGSFTPGMERLVYVNNTLFDGTYDLYMAEPRTESRWGKPWKISPMLNSPDDEISPVWLSDGKTMVFSSRGLSGLGGYDLFRTVYDPQTRTFSEPENLGYPINSPGNDTHYFEVERGKKMFIASARASGLGSTDIYLIVPHQEASARDW